MKILRNSWRSISNEKKGTVPFWGHFFKKGDSPLFSLEVVMDILMIIFIPSLFLVLGALMFIVSRVMEFSQSNRYFAKQRGNSLMFTRFMTQIAIAKSQLGKRAQELEALSMRLQMNNEELARLNNRKMKFLSMAVHDIRNPLTAITGYSDILSRNKNIGPKEQVLSKMILTATRQINHLMGDLTDLAVIEAGKFKMEMAPFDLAGLIQEVGATLAPGASNKGVILSVLEPPSGIIITADRYRIWRVLTNLLGNAVKFTPSGGRVELRAEVAAGMAMISVQDNGPGIHPTERRKIFEKFYQSKHIKDEKARKGGWGLGLAIAQEIVQAHGGEIGVDSRGLGHGSTFWVRIPLKARRPIRSSPMRLSLALIGFLALSFIPKKTGAQTVPFLEKSKFEKSLETKVDGVLLNILGPNRAKVIINATLNFTKTESFQTEGASVTTTKTSGLPYLWQEPSKTAQPEELLPGVPLDSGGPALPMPPPSIKGYKKEDSFPAEFIKRLDVTLILDNSVKGNRSAEIGKITSDLLNLNPKRGDSLTVVHTEFSPIWKTVWYSPATAGMLLKYILTGFLFFMALIVIAIGFIKIANAMRMMANAQAQQISMEMKGLDGEGGSGPGGLLGHNTLMIGDQKSGENVPENKNEPVMFDVGMDQVETLAQMLLPEPANNIAIVASRLTPDVSKRLIEALPPELATQVISQLARPRFIDPEIIVNLKEELERRLSGAVGGVHYLSELMSAASQKRRHEMLEAVRAQNPNLAEELRKRVFFIEDLSKLSQQEWSYLLSLVTYQEWSAALHEGPQVVVEAIKQNLSEKAWGVLSEMIETASPSIEQAEIAQDKIGQSVSELIKEQRIKTIAPQLGLQVHESPIEEEKGAESNKK